MKAQVKNGAWHRTAVKNTLAPEHSAEARQCRGSPAEGMPYVSVPLLRQFQKYMPKKYNVSGTPRRARKPKGLLPFLL
ncbi:MAG: hypothetical protein FWG99_01650 [Treponema sp.]|nr:hypothetical protein [Treponema sp.]